GRVEASREFGMILTPVAEGNLREYLECVDLTNPLDSHIRPWLPCLASGLTYLHSLNILHKDIKPQNILCHGDNILYTDFGLSKLFQGDTLTVSTDPSGTVKYCAPEVRQGKRSGRRSDVFSLGTVYLEMLTVASGRDLGKL
ncbi:kinase-like domain-containing protein, partial [Dendryphion nanum]